MGDKKGMTLPILNNGADAPRYKTTLPSGKEITYRPFLVKEEKILIMASESDNPTDAVDAIGQIVENCTFGKVKAKDISQVDLEWLFVQLKIRASGKMTTLLFRCQNKMDDGSECGHRNEIEVDTSTVKVLNKGNNKKTIELEGNVGMKLVIPSFSSIKSLVKIDKEQKEVSKYDLIITMIKECLDCIYDGDIVFNRADIDDNALNEFIENLNKKQISDIQDFFENMPKVILDVPYICQKCGAKETIELEGLQNFFG